MKKLLQIGLLLVGVGVIPLLTPKPHHTWTLVQVKTAVCSASPCSATLTSTGSGNLLVAGLNSLLGSRSISSITAGACTGSWVISAASLKNNGTGGAIGSTQFAYCLNSASGQTAAAITLSGTCSGSNCATTIWEVSSNTGSIALDTGATPAGIFQDNASCTNCAGTVLTLSSNNKFIAGLQGAGSSACSGVAGTGWVNDFTSLNGCQAHALNISTSGSYTAPTTYTINNNLAIGSAIAFQEAAAAGGTRIPSITIIGIGD